MRSQVYNSLILLLEDAVIRAAIVAAIASTAFIIFVIPHSEAASPRKVVGGHLTAVIVGSVISGILSAFGVDTLAGNSRYIFMSRRLCRWDSAYS